MRSCGLLVVLVLFTSPIDAFREEAAVCAPGDNKDDCQGLSQMKFAHHLARFADGTPLCGWTGVTCDANDRVILLDLSQSALTGTIPDSVSLLAALERLVLEINSLTGTIPESIGSLTALQSLVLDFNSFQGTIPESIGKLTALRYLSIGVNALTGSIPDSIGALTALQAIDLDANSLTGGIPESIGSLNVLNELKLSDNGFTAFPKSICKLINKSELRYAVLGGNNFICPMPDCAYEKCGATCEGTPEHCVFEAKIQEAGSYGGAIKCTRADGSSYVFMKY